MNRPDAPKIKKTDRLTASSGGAPEPTNVGAGPVRAFSPITRRILAINVLALGILVAGLLFLGQYRISLIQTELTSLKTQAELFAAALGEGAVSARDQTLAEDITRQMVRRLVETTGTRARLFDGTGSLVADSRLLVGPGGVVTIEVLPAPDNSLSMGALFNDLYFRVSNFLTGRGKLESYHESAVQHASDYEEVVVALSGDSAGAVRRARDHTLVLSAAVPVTRYKHVLGALMLSRDSRDLDTALDEVRQNIMQIFALALGITFLLSVYLANTISAPLKRLATAAERIRRGHHRQHQIPDFSDRDDELGDLSLALQEMTEALWIRMDAIESFAADVAHEIKNPLTSLKSAVETASRVKDPDQQRKLMTIIQEDVERLDRLISDISDASRLDAELSRAEAADVPLVPMLETLVDVYGGTAEKRGIRLVIENESAKPPVVWGIDSRLAQVFRNLITNALSFSPEGGTITLRASTAANVASVSVLDDGPGIPKGSEDAIFKRFYTERPESEKFGKHSGLGLSISKQIVEQAGGSICAGNRTDREGNVIGALFTVRLPLSKPGKRNDAKHGQGKPLS